MSNFLEVQKKFLQIGKLFIKFTLLNKILLISILLFGLNFTSAAQSKTAFPPQDQPEKVKILNFYPSPASTVISFDFQRGYSRAYTLQIFNFIGRPVVQLKNVSLHNTINLQDFYRGIYIFKLIDPNGRIVESGKFQVIK